MITFTAALNGYRDELLSEPRCGQLEQVERCLHFLANDPDCFERSNSVGHFTGSALVVDDRLHKTLICHHVKYNQWVQTGGHCDGITDPFFTAWQEAYQESGIKDIRPLSPWRIADIDIVEVEQYGDTPAHLHYDIRYIFSADSTKAVEVSNESHDVRWVGIPHLRQYTHEEALLRLVERHFGPGSTRG